MFIARLDYALSHLGWIGYLTAIYFVGFGVCLAHLLWRRTQASTWRARSEMLQEYVTLSERALRSQRDLIDANANTSVELSVKQEENDHLQRLLDESHSAYELLQQQSLAEQHALEHRDSEIVGLRDDLLQAERLLERERLLAQKNIAGEQTKLSASGDRIDSLVSQLSRVTAESASFQAQATAADNDLLALRAKYADLVQLFASAKEGQDSLQKIDSQHRLLQRHVDEIREELAASQRTVAQRDQRCIELNAQLDDLRRELDTRTIAFDDMRTLQASTVAELNAARAALVEKAELQEKHQELRSEFDAINVELEQTLLGEHESKMQHQRVAEQLGALQAEYRTQAQQDAQALAQLRLRLNDAEVRLSQVIERPDDANDLTEIVGISRRLEEDLNRSGVFRFEQIAMWSRRDEVRFEKRMGIKGRVRDGAWVEQAKELLGLVLTESQENDQPAPHKPQVTSYVRALRQYGNLSVKIDDALGVVFTRRPAQIDDLTQIRGIGIKNQACLRDHGVYRFQQIADWNEYNIWAFDQLMSFTGRIEREDWVGQAQSLASQADDEPVATIKIHRQQESLRDAA